MDIIKELKELKIPHFSCEDCWYSCPKAENYCKDNNLGCDCGADKHNDKIDDIISEIEKLTYYIARTTHITL